MKRDLDRRDFLKLIPAASLAMLAGTMKGLSANQERQNSDLPNVIILLFDAFSATHLALHGYPRNTTPNIDRFARNATVYHSHYAAGNFTIPGTASLLTGTYPWTHRAMAMNPQVTRGLASHNIFLAIGEKYHRLGFSQNIWADMLLHQFGENLDAHVDIGEFSLINGTIYNHFFPNDAFYGYKSHDDFLLKRVEKPGSLFLSFLKEMSALAKKSFYEEMVRTDSPAGVPDAVSYYQYFELKPVFEGVRQLLTSQPNPFLTYMHLYPPHEPYYPHRRFYHSIKDGWAPVTKEQSHFSTGIPQAVLNNKRDRYDEFILTVDAEFGKTLEHLEAAGLLENSYVIVTSDHGQLFERGIHGHSTMVLYEPVIRIPLLISAPKQQGRQDITTNTNCVDLLPTLLHLSRQSIPDWCEGELLPGLGGVESPDRSIYSIMSMSPVFSPIENATVALIKGQFKLIKYFGYPDMETTFELFDLDEDPEELNNLYTSKTIVARQMREELESKIEEINVSYS